MTPPKASAKSSESESTGHGWKQQPDLAVIQGCLDGDQAAWSELITRNGRLVFSIPRRYGLDTQASEDIFQDVFANLVKQLASIRNPTALPKWLITTTHRACRRWIKRSRSSAATAYPDPIDATDPAPEKVIKWERQHLVHQGLQRLGGSCEQLLSVLYLSPAEASYAEIGRQLNMPVGSIGPTRARCLKKLMEVLQRMDGDEVF